MGNHEWEDNGGIGQRKRTTGGIGERVTTVKDIGGIGQRWTTG